jgi:acetolactate synthase-1/2/3 large subunit
MTGGQAVAECLRREGVTAAFTVPGESFLAVLDAFHDHPEIRVVATRHEEGAGFAAEGYAKASGRTGVCLATRAVGASNLAIALHTARQDSTPVLALIGQAARSRRHREAFQEVELAEMFGPVVKWAVEIRDAARVPDLLAKALRLAQSGRPGPVLVAVPEDVLTEEADMVFRGPAPRLRSRPDPGDAERAARLLAEAERPAVIVGGGVLRAQATAPAIALAERLQAAVYTAFRRFDAFPNEHPLYAGPLTLGVAQSLLQPLRDADVVLALGTRLSEVTTQDYRLPPPTARLIHADIDPDTVGATFEPAVGLLGDARLVAEDLLAALGKRRRTDTRWAAAAHAEYLRLTAPRPLSGSPSEPEGLAAALREALPPGAAIVTDAGNFAPWLYRYVPHKQPGTMFGPTSGAMGYAVPAAIGVKLADPSRPVLAAAGDGGFGMTMAEVQTAARLGLGSFVVLVLDNGLYGTIAAHQRRQYPGRPVATEIGEADFAEVARGLGALAETIPSNDAFPAALARALAADRPAVLHVPIPPDRLSAWAVSR